MKTIFINYVKTYYQDTVHANVPEQYAGKFVHIRKGLTEYLVFSPKELTRFHADIVERFCTGRGIPGVYDSQHKRFDILDQDWVIIGGGKFEADGKKKLLRLYDDSLAYGKFDGRGMKEKILSVGEFSGYTVQVE